jgi:MHS family proline/betaine transporter-like MFS transporter
MWTTYTGAEQMADRRTTKPTTDGAPTRLRDHRKAVVAGGIGTVVEYFDFGAYGLLAGTLAKVFFPSSDSTVGLLQTFAVFAVAFAVRPVGGLVFGHFGDRIGRTKTMAASVILMSAGTCAVGVLPGYSAIGVGAPILLVLCRVLQGFSAGGELSGGAVLLGEYAPPARRGFYVSAIGASGHLGLLSSALLCFLLSATVPVEAFISWGWRIPFLLAVPLGLIGLYLRLRLDETPVFREVASVTNVDRAPVLRTLRQHYRQILTIVLGVAISGALGTYLLIVYIVNYLTATLKFSPSSAFLVEVIALLVLASFGPIWGVASDRIGRKPVLIIALVGLVVLSVPSLIIINAGSMLAAIVGACLIAPLISALTLVQNVVAVELFPTKVRYSGGAISDNVSQLAFAGTAPFIATALVAATGTTLAPAIYLSIVVVVSLIVGIFALRETRGSSLVFDQDQQPQDRSSASDGVVTDVA